ncbi:lactonase family protein, partial [Deinococcus pimensis]|uniref:lactonase family protein n=1 Tax=Deinococcus pimensis TaxID=309888 RepID=UPI0012FB4325
RAATTRLPGGSGPRHVAFSPDSKLAVVTLELAGGLAVLRLDEGAPELVRVVPPAEEGDQPGEAAFSPDGRFVYVSVRGRDALDVYALAEGGELERVQGVPTGGHVPRHLVLTPDGRFVLVGNQEGGTVAVFPRDADSGRVGKARLFEAPTPAGLLLV